MEILLAIIGKIDLIGLSIAFILYGFFHEKAHVYIERELKAGNTKRDEILLKMNSLKENMDRFFFKQESEEEKAFREKMSYINDMARNTITVVILKIKEIVITCKVDCKDKQCSPDAMIVLIAEFLQEKINDTHETLLKEGYPKHFIDSMQKVNQAMIPIANNKLKHIFEVHCNTFLNGAKKHAVNAMITELETSMVLMWKNAFYSVYNRVS